MGHSRARKRRIKKTIIIIAVALLCLIIIYVCIILFAPMKSISPTLLPQKPASSGKLTVDWPAGAQSAIGVTGYGLLDTNGAQTPTPTASIAKLVTAQLVLKKYPLSLGEQGPTITLTTTDVTDYENYIAEQGSVVKVVAGEQITEYQALEAMMLPSANNIADTLAIWAYGSIANYVIAANQFVKSEGMNSTTISDASGYSPSTVSTASDLIKLGQITLDSPVMSQIVDLKTAVIPVAGTITNVDYFVGVNDLIGIKTGNTDQAGGCFLSAAKYDVDGNSITVIGAVMKASNLQTALSQTMPMLNSVKSQIIVKNIAANTAISTYQMPWQSSVQGVTKTTVSIAYIPGTNFSISTRIFGVKPPAKMGDNSGLLSLQIDGNSRSTYLILNGAITKPSVTWRLLHPNYVL